LYLKIEPSPDSSGILLFTPDRFKKPVRCKQKIERIAGNSF
jgi:hypothetical protein